MAEVMIWDLWTIFFGSIAFCIFSIGGFLYLKRGKQKENFNEKIVMFGFACTLFCFAIFIIFPFFFYLNVQGTYRDNGFYIDFNNIIIIAELYIRVAWVFYYFGLLIFTIVFEINYKRTKYILTLIGCSFLLLCIIVPLKDIELAGLLGGLIYLYLTIMTILILITYARWAQIEYKIMASYLLMGILLIGWGAAFTISIQLWNLIIISVWIANLLFCLGGAFMIAPLFITVKNFSRTRIYIIIFNSFIISLQIIFTMIYIYSGIPIFGIVITYIFLPFYIYAQYTTFKSMKSLFSKDEQSKLEESKLNILGVFAKPQKLTEEEVSISKEKKICLVCKGRVRKFEVFLCDCDAFYCHKCARALIDIENACWVCGDPIDESKPVKPFKKEEEIEEIEISEKPQKKRKTKK